MISTGCKIKSPVQLSHHIKIILIFFCLLFICLLNCNTQTPEGKKDWFENGEFFYNSEDYQEAVFYFLKLHEAEPENGNINFHIGACYLNIPGQERKSIPFFEQAIPLVEEKYTSANFKSNLEQDKAPLHTYFYLAQAYRMDDQMDKALEMLDKFSNSVYFEGKYNEAMVNAEFDACKKAQIIMERPVVVDFYNLGPAINNSNENYNPVLNQDTSVIIYMNNLKFYNAIFMSKKVNSVWEEADNITPQVGSDGDSYPTFLSRDGKTLYLVKKTKKNSDIYVSRFVHDKWTIMEPLNENINSKWNETHASLSADEKRLYFASDRKGSMGGLDIWYSELQADGQWGKAINMGPSINTKLDEDNPFETADGKTLFFISQGHLNMGGFDIFYSKKEGNQWSPAINLGYPVNTTTDDKFYFPVGNGTTAYMARRMQKGYGLQDIYRVSITGGDPMKDLYPDYKKGENQLADAKLSDLNKIQPKDTTSKEKSLKNQSSVSEKEQTIISTDTASGKTSMVKTYEQDKANNEKKEQSLRVSAVFFAFNSSKLNAKAIIQLDILAEALHKCGELDIEIHAYADARGTDQANKLMSRKRSESVANYLISKGIQPGRFHSVHFGKKNPIAINTNADGTDNPRGRELNRRVEFVISDHSTTCLTIQSIEVPAALKIK